MVFTRPAPKDQHPLMFLAEAEGATRLVKLVQGGYGAGVQQTLAKKGLAPILYGSATVEGAPTAYVMEYLTPYRSGTAGWETLFTFQSYRHAAKHKPKIQEELNIILTLMEEQSIVHGDLRANNIMLELEADGAPVEIHEGRVRLKVVDFDWAGPADGVRYPLNRNKAIPWPGHSGGPVGAGHDRELVRTWWEAYACPKASPMAAKG